MQNTIVDSIGYTAAGSSIVMTGMEAVGIHSDTIIHVLASVGGLVFLVYKIYNLILDARMKREQIKNLKDEKIN